MEHKNLEYKSPEDLIVDSKLINVTRAWKTSVAHQVKTEIEPEADEIIESVAQRIRKYLSK